MSDGSSDKKKKPNKTCKIGMIQHAVTPPDILKSKLWDKKIRGWV
jgi:hypothetical protein